MTAIHERLDHLEPRLTSFDARVIDVQDSGDHQRVWLDRTAFYPTSGGQPFDTGTLDGLPVDDVIDGEDGRVVHLLQGRLEPGTIVAGRIDWPRRFDHMQQHTGQHILSAAFERLHHVRTESFRLGAEVSTIDLAREVTPDEIASAEDDANTVVWEGRAVDIRLVSADEAARLPLRKEPARGGSLRLIEIQDYDLSACGGTHVARTGEIGIIVVRGWERFRGGTRLEFVCGGRALGAFRILRSVVDESSRLLSATAIDLPGAIGHLQEESKEARRGAKLLAEKNAALAASSLANTATTIDGIAVVVRVADDDDLNALKLQAGAFVRESRRVVVLLTPSTPAQVVAMRSADVSRIDCGAVVKALTGQFGGRGGGRPEGAQGGGMTAPADALVAAAWELLAKS